VTISEICIRRPVFTWVLVAIPVVLGMVSYFELGVDLFPKVDFPVVSITANLPGTSAEEMEANVTKVIEESVNTISGVDEVRSKTREGFTSLVVQFTLEKNGDVGAQEVRDKVSSILKQLPQGMEPPIINKFDLDSAPIMTIGVSGRRPVRDVTEIARLQIIERLQTVPGVGAVFMSGNRSRAINVIVDTDKLSSYGLSVEDVRLALANQNLEVPGGIVDQGQRELVLRTLGRVQKSSQFADLIVAQRKGYPIRVRDVARVEDTIEEPRGLTRLDGLNSVSLFVQKHRCHLRHRPGEAGGDHQGAAARHQNRTHSRPVAVHPRVDAGAQVSPAFGRRSRGWHHPPLHSRLAHHRYRHHGHPHLHHSHIPVYELHGVHAEQHHHARPHSRHWHRHR
jgi:HAE1 family hydrophobic/amphiphilic exporter-1